MDHGKSVCDERLKPSCFICDVLKYHCGMHPIYHLVYWQIQLLCDKFMQLDEDHSGSQFHPGNCDGPQGCNTRFGHSAVFSSITFRCFRSGLWSSILSSSHRRQGNNSLWIYELKIGCCSITHFGSIRKVMELNIVEHFKFFELKAMQPAYKFEIWNPCSPFLLCFVWNSLIPTKVESAQLL